MIFPKFYKSISKQIHKENLYKISPIKYGQRYNIMKWRNDQIIHLRQNNILSKKAQDYYFSNVIYKTFEEKNPSQILFSFFHNNKFVAYGGLVHINWSQKNAEISFLINTKLEFFFEEYWLNFLKLIENVGFYELKIP